MYTSYLLLYSNNHQMWCRIYFRLLTCLTIYENHNCLPISQDLIIKYIMIYNIAEYDIIIFM